MAKFNLAACLITALLIGAAELHARSQEARFMNATLPAGDSIVMVRIPASAIRGRDANTAPAISPPTSVTTEELAVARSLLAATRDS